MALYKNKKQFHFRHQNNTRHYALIVGEDKITYDYFRVTHSDKRDKTHKNYKFKKNPNPKDKKNSYLEKRLENDNRKNFNSHQADYLYLSYEDYIEVLKILNNKK